MNYTRIIIKLINKYNNDIDLALLNFIYMFDLSIEEINKIRNKNISKELDIFLLKLARYKDDNLFLTEYVLGDNKYRLQYIVAKYEYLYNNKIIDPYTSVRVSKLFRILPKHETVKLTEYINGYKPLNDRLKKEKKLKRKLNN